MCIDIYKLKKGLTKTNIVFGVAFTYLAYKVINLSNDIYELTKKVDEIDNDLDEMLDYIDEEDESEE